MTHITYEFTNSTDVTGHFHGGDFNFHRFQPGDRCKVCIDGLPGYYSGVFTGRYWYNDLGFTGYSWVRLDVIGEEIQVPTFNIKPFWIDSHR